MVENMSFDIENAFQDWFEWYSDGRNYGFSVRDWKFIWFSSNIFDIHTDDDGMSLEFGHDIYEVMCVIGDRNNFDYIKDELNYKKYLVVYQLLDNFNLVECGTSVRGAWFGTDYINTEAYGIVELNELFKFLED